MRPWLRDLRKRQTSGVLRGLTGVRPTLHSHMPPLPFPKKRHDQQTGRADQEQQGRSRGLGGDRTARCFATCRANDISIHGDEAVACQRAAAANICACNQSDAGER